MGAKRVDGGVDTYGVADGIFGRTEALLIHLATPGALPDGEYRIRAIHHDTGAQSELEPIRATAPRMSFLYPLVDLPGQATLTLDYWSDGHRWFTDTTEVSIGWIQADLAKASMDGPEREVSLEMRLQSDAALQGVPLRVTASFARSARDPETRKLQITEYPPVVLLEGTMDVIPNPVPCG